MIYDWNKLLGQKNVWWLLMKSPSPTPGREGEQRREQRKWKEVQQKQVGRMRGMNLMLVGKQEIIPQGGDVHSSPGLNTWEEPDWKSHFSGLWTWAQKATGLFPLLWRSSSPLWCPLWSLLEVVQPLQGRPMMAQHSCDWVLNSQSWGQKLASPVSHISKATFSNQLC